jgi:sarcosine oxidase
VNEFDVVVIGLGGMGSAALANVALRGVSVLGIEQFMRGHLLGSSSGKSRMIRKAYYEHPNYVPLVLRAYEAWSELERLTMLPLFHKTSVLLVGSPESHIVRGASQTAQTYDLPLERMSAAEMRTRFPMVHPLDEEVGLLERDAGFIMPEAAIEGYLRVAEEHGAKMLFESKVTRWDRNDADSLLHVYLDDGTAITASRLVVCAGPLWRTFSDDAMPLQLQRNVQCWFRASSPAFMIGRFPAFMLDRDGLPKPLYGFPDHGGGVKAAFHGFGEIVDAPEHVDRAVHSSDIEPVRETLGSWMPGSIARFIEGKVCIYELSPDEHFVVGPHPDDPHVIIAGGFSGHGFKFASVIGEVLADLALEGGSQYDLAFLSPNRFERQGRKTV